MEIFTVITKIILENYWLLVPISERFTFTPWIIVVIFYLVFIKYEKVHGMRKQWKIKDQNFGWYMWAFFALPYLLYSGVRFYNPDNNYLYAQNPKPFLQIIAAMFIIIGVYLVISGRIFLNGQWGSQLYEWKKDDEVRLITEGPYGRVRHPIYAGHVCMTIGSCLIINNFYMFLCVPMVVLFAVIRAVREEKQLLEHFGDNYKDYKRDVGWVYFDRILQS